MNKVNVPYATTTRNPGDPLRAAQLHNFALRLDLRRARRDLVGSQQVVAVNRLLDATDAFGRALQWLQGGHGVTDDSLEEFTAGVVPGEELVQEAAQHFAPELACVSVGGTQ
jgi:hypothetical protein